MRLGRISFLIQGVSHVFISQITILSGKDWRLFCEYQVLSTGNRHRKEVPSRGLGSRPKDQPLLPYQAARHKVKG